MIGSVKFIDGIRTILFYIGMSVAVVCQGAYIGVTACINIIITAKFKFYIAVIGFGANVEFSIKFKFTAYTVAYIRGIVDIARKIRGVCGKGISVCGGCLFFATCN